MSDILTDDSPKDACGVFGVWAPGEEVSKLAYYGLFSLQHRGQNLLVLRHRPVNASRCTKTSG